MTRDIVEGDNLNEAFNLVTKTISAADAIILKSGLSFPKNRKPWWNKHYTDTTRNQRKSWNVFRRYPTSANQIAFKELKVSQAKDIRILLEEACSIYPEKRISCLQKKGQEVRNTLEMVYVIAEAFASICSANNYTEPLLTHKNRTVRIKLRSQTTKHLSCNTDPSIFKLHTALSAIKHFTWS
ncbi:hypothetical protein AVEN_206139-1 [Araneus ventricosus]|uniref:Uncharacterized protein n=1 Tax=Araneus ventricosus TaxID=182803 RepID=A0A4Y2LYQ6_ARAVE|nr:hypothetical protein AVEN_206139-1 [Araneus ventricosus]